MRTWNKIHEFSSKTESCIFLGYVLNTTKLYKVWSIKQRAAFYVPSNCVNFNTNEFPGSEIVTSATRVHNEPEGAETQTCAQIRPSNGYLPVPVSEQMPITSVTKNPALSQKRTQSSVS